MVIELVWWHIALVVAVAFLAGVAVERRLLAGGRGARPFAALLCIMSATWVCIGCVVVVAGVILGGAGVAEAIIVVLAVLVGAVLIWWWFGRAGERGDGVAVGVLWALVVSAVGNAIALSVGLLGVGVVGLLVGR